MIPNEVGSFRSLLRHLSTTKAYLPGRQIQVTPSPGPEAICHDELEFTGYLVTFRPFQNIHSLIIPMQGENTKDKDQAREQVAEAVVCIEGEEKSVIQHK